MSSLSDPITFDLSEIAAMPRGMTLEEARHYLMTDELPDDDPFKDLEFSTSEESERAARDEKRAQEEFDTGGLSPDEVIAFLTGERAITAAITAAASPHTGAMIALVPTEDDAGRLAVSGGLPAGELHCTIKYLGEAADISDETQDQILRRIEAAATALDVIDAEGFALAIFNPPGYVQDDGKDRDPCVVLMLSGEELSESYEFICSMVHGVIDDSYSHMPWIPHITLIETGDADLTPLVDQVGPITFDHIRVAFAGENYDFPLGSGQSGTDQSELETSEPPQMPEQDESVGSYTVDFETVFDLDHPDVQGWLNDYIAWAKERGVKSPGKVGHQLRDYWVYGPGAAKIRWNTEGDGTRCIKHMRKYVGVRAGGLCQYYHQLATGTTMGRHPGRPTEAAVGDVVPFDFDPDQPRDYHGRWRDTNPGNFHVMELADHVWNARHTKENTTIATGVDQHNSRFVLVSNGDGTISGYDEYGDNEQEFSSKEDLLDWLKLSGDNGGGADVKWKQLSVPEATPKNKPKPPPRVKVSSPPDVTSSPELHTSLERLTRVTSSDEVNTDDLSTGQVGIVSKVDTKDGSYIRKISKDYGTFKAKDITDAEDLTAELGIRIGAPVPAADRVNNDTVHMEFVDGVPAGDHFLIEDRDEDEYNEDPDREKMLNSRGGRLLGLLDLLTLNGDRHEYNWIVGKDGEPVGIDHGLGWATLEHANLTMPNAPLDQKLDTIFKNMGSPFVPTFKPYDEMFRRSDIDKARSALDAMETRFNEMGKQRWLETSRRVLDLIEEQMDYTLGQQA